MLRNQHEEQVARIDKALAQPLDEQLGTLKELVDKQKRLGELTRELRAQVQCDQYARSERMRIRALRTAKDVPAQDIALAILRGDDQSAVAGLQRVTGPLEALARSLVRPVTALGNNDPLTIKHLESALHRLRSGEERMSLTRELRGALLIALARLYRDEMRSAHLAMSALREAARLLPDQPEPDTERGELLRRSGQLDAALALFDATAKLAPHRVGAWIGLALIAEARGAGEEAQRHAGRAVDVVEDDAQPLVTLQRVQPASCKTVLLVFARRAKQSGRIALARAAFAALIELQATHEAAYPTLRAEQAWLTEPPDLTLLCDAARRLCWRREYQPAIELLQRAHRVTGGDRMVSAYLADALRLYAFEFEGTERTHRLLSAMLICGKAFVATRFRRGDAWMLLTYARIVQTLVDDNTIDDDELWLALLHCEHALALEPRNATCLTHAARLHYAVGNPITARMCADAAVAEAPDDLEAIGTLVWVLSTTGEFARARELLPKLPDSAWRRGAEAYIRIREDVTPENLLSAQRLLIEPGGDTWMRSCKPVELGLCLLLLRDHDGAREQFKATLLSSRVQDRVGAAIFMENFGRAIAEAETQRQRLRYRTDENLLGSLVIAHLAVGNVERAEQHFAELCRFLRGPLARNWAITFSRDIKLLATFRELPEPGAAVLDTMTARLWELANAEELRTSPASRELEGSLHHANLQLTNAEREALSLAFIRVAVDEATRISAEATRCSEDAAKTVTANVAKVLADEMAKKLAAADRLLGFAFSTLEALPQSERICDVRAGAAARALVAAALGPRDHVAKALALGPPPETIADLLVNTSVTAAVLAAAPELCNQPAILRHLASMLGGDEPSLVVGISPITLSITDDLVPAGDDEARLVNVTIPKVRRALQETYGATIPGVSVRRRQSTGECNLHVRGRLVGSLRAGAAERSLESFVHDALVPHLGALVGADDVVQVVDHIGEVVATEHDARLISDTGGLTRLWRLARGLLREHVPIVPWRDVALAARAGRGLPFEAMLNRARVLLDKALYSEVSRRLAKGRLVIEVPRALEDDVVSHLGIGSGLRAYLAADPEEAEAMLNAIAQTLHGSGADAILLVSESAPRPWIQQLVQLEWPAAMVITEEEHARVVRRRSNAT